MGGKRRYSSKTGLGGNYHFLDLISGEVIGDPIKDAHLLLVLLQREGFLLNMQALINTPLTEDVLFDGAVNDESVELGLVGSGGGFPLGRGYDLRDWKKRESSGEVLTQRKVPSPSHSLFYKVYPTFPRIRKSS